MQANVRYGLHIGSGLRNSARVLLPRAAGTRTRAERLAALQAEVAGCFIAGNETLVGVDRRVCHTGDCLCMLQETADIVHAGVGELQFSVWIEECILAVLGERSVGVHTAAVDAADRLCHEGCMETVLECNGLGCKLEGDDAVCSGECIAILEIDLVLAVCNFVVGSFDLKSHVGQCKDNITADIFRRVRWCEIEIGSMILKLRGRYYHRHLEQEKLKFRTGVERVAHLCCFGHCLAQDVARISFEGLVAVRLDIADEPGNLSFLGPPGKDCIGCRIRLQDHVGFFDPCKSFNG